jgi:microcystin degradation protein MlrC
MAASSTWQLLRPGTRRGGASGGLSAVIEARFNADGGNGFSQPFAAEATVVALGDGAVTGRLGLYAARRLDPGRTAVLAIGGVTVVVISARAQTADLVFFEMLGLDVAEAWTVVVKSRGHFRAGFAPWFGPAQVREVYTGGLTSPVLERFAWTGLRRPIHPLDPAAEWVPPGWWPCRADRLLGHQVCP